MSQPRSEQIGSFDVKTAYIALGSNVTSPFGVPAETLREALRRLPCDSLKLGQKSRFYETPAFPAGSGPAFVNAVVRVETSWQAREVLTHLHRIEAEMGRARRARWEARTIDLDLIALEDLVLPDQETWALWRGLPLEEQMAVAPDGLILPHPRLQDRSFVLGPLCDVAPDWVHPVTFMSVKDMFAALPAADRAALRPIDDGPRP